VKSLIQPVAVMNKFRHAWGTSA